jgi:hypothetical protein
VMPSITKVAIHNASALMISRMRMPIR